MPSEIRESTKYAFPRRPWERGLLDTPTHKSDPGQDSLEFPRDVRVLEFERRFDPANRSKNGQVAAECPLTSRPLWSILRSGFTGIELFRLYSEGFENAVRALVHVPPAAERKRFQAKVICEKAGIPEAYTRKVFHALSNGGFLEAARGPGGGYKLTEGPKKSRS